MTPLLKMYTLGSNFTPMGIHAGGLRYHGGSPLLSQLYNDGLIELGRLSKSILKQLCLPY